MSLKEARLASVAFSLLIAFIVIGIFMFRIRERQNNWSPDNGFHFLFNLVHMRRASTPFNDYVLFATGVPTRQGPYFDVAHPNFFEARAQVCWQAPADDWRSHGGSAGATILQRSPNFVDD